MQKNNGILSPSPRCPGKQNPKIEIPKGTPRSEFNNKTAHAVSASRFLLHVSFPQVDIFLIIYGNDKIKVMQLNSKSMISKKQKTWLWIFGLMFLVPEILWGDLIRVFRISFLPVYRNQYFFNNNPFVAFLVIIIEMVAISGIIYLINRSGVGLKRFKKYFLNVLLGLILLVLAISLYLSAVMSSISLF